MMPAGELWRSQQSVSCPYSPECVERLSGKCSEDALVTYAMLHGDHGEQEIPHRSVRRRMEVHQPPSPPSARAHRTRTPQATRLAGDPRCGLLRSEERMPVAAFAPRVPAVEDRIRLVQEVAHRRDLGTPKRRAERASTVPPWQGPEPPARGSWILSRQGPRGWEAKSAASTPPRMWKEESAICSSTPRVWCSKPRYTAPESPTRMASGCCWSRRGQGSRASRICGSMLATRGEAKGGPRRRWT